MRGHLEGSLCVLALAALAAGCDSAASRPERGTTVDARPPAGDSSGPGDAAGLDAARVDGLMSRDTLRSDAVRADLHPADLHKKPEASSPKADTGAAAACAYTATPSNLASVFSSAAGGKTICLAAGSYGTFTGGSKSSEVTLRPQTGASVSIELDFVSSKNIRVEGMTITGASLRNSTKNITITGCTFTGFAIIDGVANANILLDGNTHLNIMTCASCFGGRVQLPYSSTTPSGVTIQNSLLKGGNADGIQAGAPLKIINNELADIRETGPSDPAHTDAIQLFGTGTLVQGNYIHDCADGIVAYDGIDHAIIEDNVIDLVDGRFGIELYSDDSSLVRHNTLKNGTGCGYGPCGQILLDHKSSDPPGKGTVIVDNIATIIMASNGSTWAQRHHNLLPSGAASGDLTGAPTYVGGAAPKSWSGYKLAGGSVGKGGASDGLDVGIR